MIVEELKKTLALCCHVHTNHLICLHLIAERGKKQMQAEDHLQKPYFASASPVI